MIRSRLPIVLALMAGLAIAGCQKKPVGAAAQDDMSLGNANAKVTVVEYASVGCPICARWQSEVYPAFKTKYIDSGRIRYVFREMLVGSGPEVTVAASGFLVARCAGPDKYFPVVDALFAQQEQAFADPRGTLENVAKSAGMNEDQFNRCVQDENAIKALNDRVERHAKNDGINATPTFVINGKAMEPGYHSLAEIDAAIAAAGG